MLSVEFETLEIFRKPANSLNRLSQLASAPGIEAPTFG